MDTDEEEEVIEVNTDPEIENGDAVHRKDGKVEEKDDDDGKDLTLRGRFQPMGKYDGKRGIRGFIGSIIFFVHEEGSVTKDRHELDMSIDDYESSLAHRLACYLLQNEFEPRELQILSNSTQRVESIKEKLDEESAHKRVKDIPLYYGDYPLEVSGIKVTIILLKPYEGKDGEASELLKMIAPPIDDSSEGIIIISHVSLLLDITTSLWRGIVDTAFQRGFLTTSFRLHCATHNMAYYQVKTPDDFLYVSPKGGCLELCTRPYCSHECRTICHGMDRAHQRKPFLCKLPCSETCPNGHPCQNLCHMICQCSEKCEFVKKCGHPTNGKDHRLPCVELCGAKLSCGHTCKEKCHPEVTHDKMTCMLNCDRVCEAYRHPCVKPHLCSEPCPPCTLTVSHLLNCGHSLKVACKDAIETEKNYKCKQRCRKKYGLCFHPCNKMCFEECGICEVKYPRPHPICGHSVLALCSAPILDTCMQPVLSKSKPRCGHQIYVPCSRSSLSADRIAQFCYRPCDFPFNGSEKECGHICQGTCWDCYQGRFHQRCKTACRKTLICGHNCQTPCPLVCPPCNKVCIVSCEHYQCPFECGVPCDYICEEPCTYACPHLKCTKSCGKVCDRDGCMEPCPEVLPCGHKCVGFCGEQCPTLCRYCNFDELITGNFLGSSEIEETDRFILLPQCGHTIEVESLSLWIALKDDNGEISLKCCPICRKQIGRLPRYAKPLGANLNEVNQVRRAIYGNNDDLIDIVLTTRRLVKKRIDAEPKVRVHFPPFARLLLKELEQPFKCIEPNGEQFRSMHMEKARFIEWAYGIWDIAEEEMTEFEFIWELKQIQMYGLLYVSIFQMIATRNWPLHPNEMACLEREFNRLKDMKLLYSRFDKTLDDQTRTLARSQQGLRRFAEAERLLRTWTAYSEAQQFIFHETLSVFMAVQRCTLDISDRERQLILEAFGSRTGRWFKCPNGHVYVVTECGGVTEIGKCFECGETIGGENHMVLRGNQLATEMDGAQEPMYITALDNF